MVTTRRARANNIAKAYAVTAEASASIASSVSASATAVSTPRSNRSTRSTRSSKSAKVSLPPPSGRKTRNSRKKPDPAPVQVETSSASESTEVESAQASSDVSMDEESASDFMADSDADSDSADNVADADDNADVVNTASEEEEEEVVQPTPAKKRRRTTAKPTAKTTARKNIKPVQPETDQSENGSDDDVENGDQPTDQEAAPPTIKYPEFRGTVESMPVFSDMNLMLSLQPLPTTSSKIAQSFSREKNRVRKNIKEPLKGGKKRLYNMLEGDHPDDDKSLVDPRTLEMSDVDYSKYSALFRNHPHLRHTWSSLTKQEEVQKISQPDNLKIKLLPFQQEGVWWMSNQESTQFHGGILADEMGMGKTLQTIALLLVNRGKPTLVICPTVALLQWKSEIEAATDDLSVLVYYGDDRRKILDKHGAVDKSKLDQYDVVLTTYAVMETGFRRERTGFRLRGQLHHEKSALHAVDWFRVVLDEAHNIKDRSSNSARAAFELKTERVWGLTGTPLHNRVGELYSLIRMTKSDPFSMYFCHICPCKSLHWNFKNGGKYCEECLHMYTTHFCYWNMHILKPIQQNDVTTLESRVGFQKLGRLLDSIMLRRTKVERAEDMGLPPRIVVTRRDKFSPEEEDLYVSLFSNYQREFDTYAMHGTVLNNYANIFELITRMRLAANHPDLLRLKVDAKERVGADAGDTLVCAICTEEAEDPIVSKCKHVFCRVDAQQYVNGADESTTLRCPMCFALFDIDLTQPEIKTTGNSRASAGGRGERGSGGTLMETMLSTPDTREYRRSIVNRIDMTRWKSSTKIEALVEELSRHRQGNANIKSIVFSQFVNFLDLIQWRLNRAGFSVCRLDGRMSPSQRDAVIRTFMTHPEYTVFLVSLKAGGVALNLTEASNVYLADCWWNPSVEVQAMDRIHRMGQYRPIKVTRIIIENSIESRIVALQVKKQHLVNSTIGRDKKSLENLSAQDMQFLFSS
ncbi:DNA repair protein rad16 [Coemansia sp. RSA 2607]|nr:DNA repair protein rad16 [Coemansia sp. RSA 2607]